MHCRDGEQLRQITRRQLLSCLMTGLFLPCTWLPTLHHCSTPQLRPPAPCFHCSRSLWLYVLSYFWGNALPFKVKLGIACAVAGGLIVGGGDLLIVTGKALFSDLPWQPLLP